MRKQALTAIILAAGKGVRMKSDLPKVLHEIWGRPLLAWILRAAEKAGAGRFVVVVGHRADSVKKAFAGDHRITWALQRRRLGTGHAAGAARRALRRYRGDVLVLYGDTPLLDPLTLRRLVREQKRSGASGTILTSTIEDQAGKGRVIRSRLGEIEEVVEEVDCTPEQRAIKETNSGVYCFHAPSLFSALRRIRPANKQGEYYLTDVVAALRRMGKKVSHVPATSVEETLSVNTRAQLAQVATVMMRRRLDELMAKGVTIVDPATTLIEPGARIGRDSVIYPFTYISCGAVVRKGSRVGPFAFVQGVRFAEKE
jgi:bifunctional UDP-N-acetylglucosamine pyrophosphorylase/glucosamine-1-phosphate N-acetyltransferase